MPRLSLFLARSNDQTLPRGKAKNHLILAQACKSVICCLVRDGVQVTSSRPFITVNISAMSSGITGRVNNLADKYKMTCNRGINMHFH